MKQLSLLQSSWLILIAPLLIFPLMINLRVFPFIAPNEEPKWALLTTCGLWMGLAAAWLWFQRKQPLTFQKPSLAATLLLIYLLLLAIGIFIGPNTTEGMIRFAFWFFSTLVFVVAVWAIRYEPQWMNALVWSLSVGSFIFSLRYWEGYFLDYGKANYNIAVLFSPIGHINFTGDVLIILLPMLMWILATKSNPTLRLLNVFSVTTIGAILLVASSRGALGGLALASLIAGIIIVKHYIHSRQSLTANIKALPVFLLVLSLAGSALIYTSLPYHYRDLARVSATATQAVEGKGKKVLTPHAQQPPLVDMWVALSPLLGARTNIFAATTAMTLDAPLLGQGTGNFAWVYPSFSNRYPDFRDALSSTRTFTTNPHNVVLQIASQNGIPAMLIFMGLLLLLWWKLASHLWHTFDGYVLAGLAAVSAAIFDAMFNHVFFNPASMFVFALLGGSWWGYISRPVQTDMISINGKHAAFVACVFAVVLSIWPIRWVVSEWYAGQAMAHAQYPALEKAFYQKAYAWDKENFRAVFGIGQIAYKEKRYTDAILYFEAFQRFYPYNPPAQNMLGAAYMMAGQYDKAVDTFKLALATYPGFEMAAQNLYRAQILATQNKQQTPQP